MEEAKTARLFSSLDIGPQCRLRHRTWVPAMVPWRATEAGFVTPALLDWYGRLADGEPGAIVVEATGIRDVPSGPLLRIGHDRFIEGLARLVEHVRARSRGQTRIFIQLIDFLRIRRRPPRERFLRAFVPIDEDLRARLAAEVDASESAVQQAPEDQVRAWLTTLDDERLERVLGARAWHDLQHGARQRITDLHEPDIAALPAQLPSWFAKAAERARRAGFDGVEIHAAHAYTLASFLSLHNTRPDGHGGDEAGRLRVPLAVVRAVVEAVGATCAVGLRLDAAEDIPGGHGPDVAARYAVALAAAGLDYLSLSRGGKFEDARQPRVGWAAYPYTGPSGLACMPTVKRHGDAARGLSRPLGRQVRQALRAAGLETPVVLAGGLHTFAQAEGALRAGDCDIVAAARQSLADPDWWKKMASGRGEAVRRCTLSNYCEGLDQKHKAVTCKLWDRQPATDQERRRWLGPSHQGQRRLVAP